MRRILGLVVLVSLLSASQSEASQIWSWSFAGEAGRFVTSGSAPLPGTYSFEDFLVMSSGAGGTLGSVTGGQYVASGFATNLPYNMTWDGSQVTFWDSAGSNSFDWWVFDDLSSPQFYFFGWDTGNINDVHRAALYDPALGVNRPISVGDVSVTPYGGGPGPIPEPASLLLLGTGLAGLRVWRKRR